VAEMSADVSNDPRQPLAPALGAAAQPVQVELKVPFHDCDPLFVVWHGRYFQYLEIARSALFARHRLDVEHVRGMNYRMYVTDARCRYMFPLSYNDVLRVSARFTSISPLLRIAYDLHNLTAGRKSARALTVMATTDVSGNLLTETPADVLERLQIMPKDTHGR
jgi:acyl-CoA thioester hydrolase